MGIDNWGIINDHLFEKKITAFLPFSPLMKIFEVFLSF